MREKGPSGGRRECGMSKKGSSGGSGKPGESKKGSSGGGRAQKDPQEGERTRDERKETLGREMGNPG